MHPFPARRRAVLPEVGEVGSADVLDEDGLVAVGRALRPDPDVGKIMILNQFKSDL